MIFHENRLPADDSHEISCLICYFWKSSKIWNCRLLQIIGGALWVNLYPLFRIMFLSAFWHLSWCTLVACSVINMDPDQIAMDPDQIDFSRRSSMIMVHSVCFHEKRGLECIRIYERANTFSGKTSCICENKCPWSTCNSPMLNFVTTNEYQK